MHEICLWRKNASHGVDRAVGEAVARGGHPGSTAGAVGLLVAKAPAGARAGRYFT